MRWLIQGLGHLLAPAARRFHHALDHPQAAQRRVQREIGDRLIRSEYGRSLGIQTLSDWHRVPIVTYDDIQDWIASTVLSHRNLPSRRVLTPDPILFYEKTSGSRGAAKSIPYTRSLRRSFNQMFCVWAHDLICNGPPLTTGKTYFCFSPPIGTTQNSADDSDYLDPWLRLLMRPFWVQPDGVHRIHDVNEFKEKLCLTLLREERLEIISIWSPSFLSVHLDYIHTHRLRLREILRDQLSSERYELLGNSPIPWHRLWTQLKLISCWDSAAAADQANRLRSRFPGVLIQGKGLLATETPMTIPLIAAQGCVPVLDEVFFEFEDNRGSICLLHELEFGNSYEVIVSQKGGLYRYRMGDSVRVTHLYKQTPCLEFLGRTQSTSDLVGEKLSEAFVRDALNQIGLASSSFKCLIPATMPSPHYILLLDHAPDIPEAIAQQLDQALCQAHHYSYARQLQQLAPVRVMVSPHIPEIMTQHQLQRGKRWGDLKHPLLMTRIAPSDCLTALEQAHQQAIAPPNSSFRKSPTRNGFLR
ncbi:MAG TPA: GH3 family domain-containing protein [Elainellaceae cyanobacterium]